MTTRNLTALTTDRPATATVIFDNGLEIQAVQVWLQANGERTSMPFEVISFTPDIPIQQRGVKT